MSNTLQIFPLYIISIKIVAKKVVYAPIIISQSTKKEKNLKFDCMTL